MPEIIDSIREKFHDEILFGMTFDEFNCVKQIK